ncbi:hypothetical protein NEDG_02146 [Nematocida displodere]|uniref:Uncharacterized protein n=1 Tax=Nematocida displodere TaxID=1805483 RepID=A0A177EI15_9MICR|nr:hypothetical protein NEDG_02146 [Nematocida displodere]
MDPKNKDQDDDFELMMKNLVPYDEVPRNRQARPQREELEIFDMSVFDNDTTPFKTVTRPVQKAEPEPPSAPKAEAETKTATVQSFKPEKPPVTEEEEYGWSLEDYLPKDAPTNWLQVDPKQHPAEQHPVEQHLAEQHLAEQHPVEQHPVEQAPESSDLSKHSFEDGITDEKAGTFDWSAYDNYVYNPSDDDWIDSLDADAEGTNNSSTNHADSVDSGHVEDQVNQEIDAQIEQGPKHTESESTPEQTSIESITTKDLDSVESLEKEPSQELDYTHDETTQPETTQPEVNNGPEELEPIPDDFFGTGPGINFLEYLQAPEDTNPTCPQQMGSDLAFSVALPTQHEAIALDTVSDNHPNSLGSGNQQYAPVPEPAPISVPVSAPAPISAPAAPIPTAHTSSPFPQPPTIASSVATTVTAEYKPSRICFAFVDGGIMHARSTLSRIDGKSYLPEPPAFQRLEIDMDNITDYRKKTKDALLDILTQNMSNECIAAISFLKNNDLGSISTETLKRQAAVGMAAETGHSEIDQLILGNNWPEAFFTATSPEVYATVSRYYAKATTPTLPDYFYTMVTKGNDRLATQELAALSEEDLCDIVCSWKYLLKGVVLGKASSFGAKLASIFFEQCMFEEAATILFATRAAVEVNASDILATHPAPEVLKTFMIYKEYFEDKIDLVPRLAEYIASLNDINRKKAQELYHQLKDQFTRPTKTELEAKLQIKPSAWGISGLMSVVDKGISRMIGDTETMPPATMATPAPPAAPTTPMQPQTAPIQPPQTLAAIPMGNPNRMPRLPQSMPMPPTARTAPIQPPTARTAPIQPPTAPTTPIQPPTAPVLEPVASPEQESAQGFTSIYTPTLVPDPAFLRDYAAPMSPTKPETMAPGRVAYRQPIKYPFKPAPGPATTPAPATAPNTATATATATAPTPAPGIEINNYIDNSNSDIDHKALFADTSRYQRIEEEPQRGSWLAAIPGISALTGLIRKIGNRGNIPVVELAQDTTFIYDKVARKWITVNSKTMKPIKIEVTQSRTDDQEQPKPKVIPPPKITGPMPKRGADGKLDFGPRGTSLEARYGKPMIPIAEPEGDLPVFAIPKGLYSKANAKVFIPAPVTQSDIDESNAPN